VISLCNDAAKIVEQLLQELIFGVDFLLHHIEERLLRDFLVLDVLIQVFAECIHVSTIVYREGLLGVHDLIVERVEFDHLIFNPLDLYQLLIAALDLLVEGSVELCNFFFAID
jgi:hypothetical protein